MSGSLWRPKRPAWFRATIVVIVLTTAAFAGLAWWSPWRAGSIAGLSFGIAAAVLFINAALYPARRRLRAWPWGTVQRWLQLHIYGSVIAAWCVLLHMGFQWPAGQLGWWLLILSLWTCATGVLGVILQKRLPIVMTRGLQVEAIYERIPDLIGRLVAKADAVAKGVAAIDRTYQADWRPRLGTPAPAWAFVGDPARECDRRIQPLREMGRFVSAEDRGKLDDLEVIVREKFELDAHLSLQRALRTWLLFHVPPAGALLGLMGVHVVAVWLF